MSERAVSNEPDMRVPRTAIVTTIITLISLTLIAGCVQGSVEPLTVPLQYQTMASVAEFPTFPDCAAVSDVVVIDSRDDPVLGDRANEGKDAAPMPVTTSSDVSAWIRDGAFEGLKASGISLGRSEAPVLRFEVVRIRTFENVYRRAGYEGQISLSAEIVSPAERGTVCLLRQSNGSAGNYGYAGSAENYQETLNHALDRALIALLDNPDIRRALCEGCE